MNKDLNISWRVAPEIPPVLRGDPGRLRQVLVNLLGNAVKFTSDGHIVVRARLAGNAATDATDPDGRAEIRVEVEDTGIGIRKADLGKLFQDFTQVDSSVTRKYGGTGLGLAVTRQLIELMDGRVGVQSTLGRGSTFWFEIALPASTQAADGEAAKLPDQQIYARAAAAGSEPDSRALVAEDNAINSKLLVAYLKKMGLRADTVENGRQAVDAVRLVWYDIVLMDVQMPEMDDFEAAREIRRLPGERGQVPIIAITAFTSSEDIERCIAAGMNDFVAKPIDRAQLRDAVEKWSQDKDGASETQPAKPVALSPPDNEIIEPSILKGLAESLGAGKTRELVALYIDDIQSRLERLLKAADAQDFATLRKEAHDVRSTSGSLGLTKLFALGEGIENACADDREADALRLTKEVTEACKETIAALRARL